MEIDQSIDWISPDLNGRVGVDQHHLSLSTDCTDCSFGNTILMIIIWRAWLVGNTAGCKYISEGLGVVFTLSILAPESLDLISY